MEHRYSTQFFQSVNKDNTNSPMAEMNTLALWLEPPWSLINARSIQRQHYSNTNNKLLLLRYANPSQSKVANWQTKKLCGRAARTDKQNRRQEKISPWTLLSTQLKRTTAQPRNHKAVQNLIFGGQLAGGYLQPSGTEEVIIRTTSIPALLKLYCVVLASRSILIMASAMLHHSWRVAHSLLLHTDCVSTGASCQRPRAKQWGPPAQTL